jgi:hypothetical protein
MTSNDGAHVLAGGKTLFVTPVQDGSGETVTALHIAERAAQQGASVTFLAAPFARRFIEGRFPDSIRDLGASGPENHRAWRTALEEIDPDIVVFADYPLMFFPQGCVPLAREPGWVESLEDAGALLVTLDHFGFAQAERSLFLGPPHLGFHASYRTPPLPVGMRVMLPCPMHEPGAVPGRVGEAFRYWDVPLGLAPGVRERVRARYLASERDVLVFHSVPNWAIRGARRLGLTFYDRYIELLEDYLGGSPATVRLVSINDGGLLDAARDSSLRVTNLAPVPTTQFEELLFSADLVLTENKLSISMGKAVCALQPSAVLTNSMRLPEIVAQSNGRARDVVLALERDRLASVYRYAAFPSVTPEDVAAIGLYRGNRLPAAFVELEVFGGEATRTALQRLLFHAGERDALRRRQQEYVQAVAALPDGARLLAELPDRESAGGGS